MDKGLLAFEGSIHALKSNIAVRRSVHPIEFSSKVLQIVLDSRQ